MASARRWTETARSLAKSAWPRPRAATVNCRRRRFTIACWTVSPISAAASLGTTPPSWSLLFPRQTAHLRPRVNDAVSPINGGQINRERCHLTFDCSLDSHRLCHSDNRYIYSPFEEIPKYAPRVRFVVVPVMLLSGFWMWKGHVLRRLISKRSALKVTQ